MAASKKKAPTAEEVELTHETEVRHLMRVYKQLTAKKTSLTTAKSGPAMKLQQAKALTLKELEGIKMRSTDAETIDSSTRNKISSEVTRYGGLKTEIEKINVEISELKNKIAEAKVSLHTMAGNNISELQEKQVEETIAKHIKTMEAKIKVEKLIFDTSNAENRSLRAQIDTKLMERKLFREHWEHHVRSLAKRKNKITCLVDQSVMAYDQRKMYQTKLEQLEKQDDHNLAVKRDAMRDVQQVLEDDKKQGKFLQTKNIRRLLTDLTFLMEKRQEKLKSQADKNFVIYNDLIKDILTYCEEPSVKSVLEKYKNREHEIFQLYNHLIESGRHQSVMISKIEEYRNKIREALILKTSRLKHQEENLESLKMDVSYATEKANTSDIQKNKIIDKYDHLAGGIESAFNMIECDKSQLSRLLGDGDKVTPRNIRLYLQLIEQKTEEMVQFVWYDERDRELPAYESVVRRVVMPSDPITFVVEQLVSSTPCPLDTKILETALTMPVTRAELYLKFNANVNTGRQRNFVKLHSLQECKDSRAIELQKKNF